MKRDCNCLSAYSQISRYLWATRLYFVSENNLSYTEMKLCTVSWKPTITEQSLNQSRQNLWDFFACQKLKRGNYIEWVEHAARFCRKCCFRVSARIFDNIPAYNNSLRVQNCGRNADLQSVRVLMMQGFSPVIARWVIKDLQSVTSVRVVWFKN
jgi:hypothetical protein